MPGTINVATHRLVGARREQLGEEHRGDLRGRVDVESGAGEPAPGELALVREHLACRRIHHNRHAEPEPDAPVRRLGEDRPAERLQVEIAGQVVAGHVRDGVRAQQPGAVELAAAGEHLGEAVIVGRGGDQPSAAGQERRLTGGGVPHRRVAQQPACRVRHVQPGEPVELVGSDPERRVVHAEWCEHLLGEERVEPLPGRHLDDPAQHVGGHRVVPFGAWLEQQRQSGPQVTGRGEVHAARDPELETLRAVDLVDGVGVVEAVGEPRGVGEQMPDAHRFRSGHGARLGRRTRAVHPHVGEGRDVAGHRVGQLEQAPLVEHQDGHRRDRLAHRVDAPDRVVGDGPLRLDVGDAVVREQRHPAAAGDRHRPAREQLGVDVAAEVRVDPLQPLRVEPDLFRLGIYLELRHGTDTTAQ
jgi:hypothetical protein